MLSGKSVKLWLTTCENAGSCKDSQNLYFMNLSQTKTHVPHSRLSETQYIPVKTVKMKIKCKRLGWRRKVAG